MTTSLNTDSDATISRLTMAELDWAADFLTNVFLGGTPITKLFYAPDIERKLRYFMACNCALALNTGECYATAARDGLALWLPPGKSSMSIPDMWKAGMFRAPVEYGLRGTAKIIGFAHHIEAMHKLHALMPHYYLFLTGVDPKQQRQGVSTALLGNMLERIDTEQMPVYLETQSASNVEVYQKLGFEMVGKRAFPFTSDVFNWGMLRP
ncbi:MAG: GNAT family N-acetyltransferase, partial [Betaproteobacteria bacterium]